MRYLLRGFIGFAMIAFGWMVLGYAIYQLLQIGTCASGGPYVSARQCPDGTAGLGLMIPAGVIAILAGAAIWSGRGKAPGSDRPPRNEFAVIWVWTGIFWSIAVGTFLGVWGPEANPGPGGKLGGLIVGFLFVPMGAGGLLVLGGRASRAAKAEMSSASPDTAAMKSKLPGATRARKLAGKVPGLDPVARIERLQSLREKGAITDAEFEQMKQQVLAGR